MGRPNKKTPVVPKPKRDRKVVVSGGHIRDYVDKINLTSPQFSLAMSKETREEVIAGMRESQYELCRTMLGYTSKRLGLIERAMAMALEMNIPFEKIKHVEFYKGQTIIQFL